MRRYNNKGSIVGVTIFVPLMLFVSGMIFMSYKNMIKASNMQKDTFYVNNILLSEIEEYKSLKPIYVKNSSYEREINNKKIIVDTQIIGGSDIYKEVCIEVSLNNIKKSKTIKLLL